MAYNPNDPNKLKDEGDEVGISSQPVQLSQGQSATVTGGSSVSQITPGNTPAPSSSGWTNLKTYIDRNKPQAAQLGSQVAGIVTDKAKAADSSISDASRQFSAAVDPNAYKVDQSFLNKSASNANNLSGADTNKFRSALNMNFNGPASLQDTDYGQNAANAVNLVDATAKQAVDYKGGQQQLLRDNIQRANATQGVTNLNTLFTQSSDEGRGAIEKGIASLADYELASKLSQANTAAEARVNEARLAAQDTVNAAKSALSSARDNTYSAIDNRVAANSKAQAELVARANQAIYQNTNLSDSDIRQLGITRDDFNLIKNHANNMVADVVGRTPLTDLLTNYISIPTLNRANQVTAEEAARLNALAQLANSSGVSVPTLSKTNAGSTTLNLDRFLKDYAQFATKPQTQVQDSSGSSHSYLDTRINDGLSKLGSKKIKW